MKQLLVLFIYLFIGSSVFSQSVMEQTLKDLESNDTTFVVDKKIIQEPNGINWTEKKDTVKSSPSDTTTIRFGKRKIVVIEKDGSTSIEIPEKHEFYTFDSDDENDFTYKKKPSFKGHWAGFEWGFNGFMDPNYSINMKDDLKYLELRQGRSWNINLNVMQYSIGFGTDKIGLVTGLGFEFNDYHFRNETNIKVENGVTVVDNFYIDNNLNVTKSKLSTTHLTVPLLLEFQIPTGENNHRIFFSTGVIGGVRIGSHTKVEFEGATEGKDKKKDDYNLSAFRYGITARIGYRGLKLFANYYPTPFFEESKGDEIYPFSVGLILLSF
jgi:acetyltransferase-like isoleucine patch superfamily enzyme